MAEATAETINGGERDVIIVAAPSRSRPLVVLKRCVQCLFHLAVLPRLGLYHLLRSAWGRRSFLTASESIARIPGVRGVYCRQAFYHATLDHCGQDIYFGWLSTFSMPEARVGDQAYIGRRCGIGFADIGAGAMLADGVQILSGGHEHGRAASGDESHREKPQQYQRLSIGKGAWIGTNAVIMADVGDHAIVGAGAVVNRPIPPRAVAVGVPAKVVKYLDRDAPAAP